MFQSAVEVTHYLKQNKNHIHYDLDYIQEALGYLEHPEKKLNFIHIAGTNGKGSTAAMIYAVLKSAGYGTGMFTSPYISVWNEQIQFNGQSISDQSVIRWANHVWKETRGIAGKLSHYEFLVLLSLCYYAYEVSPDFVVWETGLGGRLDATNVVTPIVSVLTPISMDHQAFLGNHINQIAAEKAAIIKKGVPVVCSHQDKEALAVIQARVREQQTPLYVLNQDFFIQSIHQSVYGHQFHFAGPSGAISQLIIPLVGHHQLVNAATATMTLDLLREQYAEKITPDVIRQGLQTTYWPGRLEMIRQKPMVILDGAHNIASAKALTSTIQDIYTYDRLILMTAMMKDKDVEQIIPYFTSLADEVITTQVPDQARSLSSDQLAKIFHEHAATLQVTSISEVQTAVDHARGKLQPNDLLLITGSLYFISVVRPQFILV